jgi:hypothetical protein
MRDAYQAIGQGEPYTEGGLDLMFAALQDLSMVEIQQALVHHMNDPKNGKWRPNAAMVREQIARRAAVPWVSGDEAWATVPKLETDTGILNQVTAEALAIAQPLIDTRDMIAARRAFIDAYNVRVERAKMATDPAQRVPMAWVTCGNRPMPNQDSHGERMIALERGRAAGVLPAPKYAEPAPQLGHSIPPPGAMEALRAFRLKQIPLSGADNE